MKGEPHTEVSPHFHWYGNGQSALSGDLLDLFRRLDRQFLRWAGLFDAKEFAFPPLIAASELAKLDYFHSFPHLVTFAATLAPDEVNLKRFQADESLDEEGAVRLAGLAPVREVLTPAACYHFYVLLQGQILEAPRFLTTRATCFRREASYVPLERQWSFSMREIVCLGTEAEVQEFLSKLSARVEEFCATVDLPIRWETATDSFFDPARNPKYLLQKIEPVKKEMVFEDRLAIGSVNFHRNFFGEIFGIRREGEDVYSGCVAFGLERWIRVFLTRFGSDSSRWPIPDLERANG